MQLDQQKLVEKLDECKHYDKDNRYMAATDLCAEMLKQNVQLEEAMERRICSAFMAHLDDTSLDVQGNAVKCIQKIATKIREKNLVMVVEKMSERVVEGEKETRDIYSMAIRSIINEINEEYAIAVIRSVYPKLLKGMTAALDVREECLDILADIFKRFGPLLLKNATLVNKDELMRVIPDQLSVERPSLRKKATNCMGAFAVILTTKQLHQMCLLLIDRIKKSKSKTDSFTLIQCFAQMARTVGNKIATFLNDIFPLLSNFASQLNKEQSVDIDNEITEACLSTFENLIKKCPKEIGPYVESILELAQNLISYDPNYTYEEGEDARMHSEEDDGGWGSEFEDEDVGNEDDDDTSWKVRRAAIKTIEAIITSRPELLSLLYQRYARQLVNRFKERDDNVKCNVLETFQTLLKSTVVSESTHTIELELSHQPSLLRTRSSTDELIDLIPVIVDTLLKQLKSKNLKVRVTVMDTFANLAHALHSKLGPYYERMLPEFEKNMKETQSYDLILDTLIILRRLFRSKDFDSTSNVAQHYKRTLDIIMQALNHEYSKVVSEGLRVAGSFVYVLRTPGSSTLDEKFSSIIAPLYQAIMEKLQKADIDQEVKQCSIIAMASFITVCHQKLNQAQIHNVILIYQERLHNELTRDATLKAITKIAQNQGAPDQTLIGLTQLNLLLPRIFELLHKTQRTLHLNTLEALVAIIERYPVQFQDQSSQIMRELIPFISDVDLQAASLALKVARHTLQASPGTTDIQDVISKSSLLANSTIVQGSALLELLNFFAMASRVNVVKDQTISELYNYVSLNTQAAAKCLAQIALNSSKKQQLLNDFLTRVQDASNVQNQIKGALCLGEFGKQCDVSSVPNIINIVSNLFKGSTEEVRTAGSICLGNISVGNTDFFLERVFTLVDKSEHQEKYLFLNTIREIIIHNSKCLRPYLPKLLPLLIDHSKSNEESIRNIVAESIGRLFIVYATDMYNDIESCFKSANNLVRGTIVKSFKYAGAKETESLPLEMAASELIKLVEEKDLNVKRNALESLNTIVHNQPQTVRNDVEKLTKVALYETQIKPELITEVDLGPFKHKVDEGVPIRKAAYALIDTIIEKIPERTEINQIVEVVIKGVDDTAEECMIICLHILGRLINWAPTIVISSFDSIVDIFEKQFQKNLKLISTAQSSEKAQNIMRAILRVVEQLQRTPDADANARFNDFFKTQVMENPHAKEMYEKIAATASQAVIGEHF